MDFGPWFGGPVRICGLSEFEVWSIDLPELCSGLMVRETQGAGYLEGGGDFVSGLVMEATGTFVYFEELWAIMLPTFGVQ